MNTLDKQYFEFIKNKDYESADKLIQQVAIKKGYKIKAYHGSLKEFNKFSYDFLGKTGSSEGYGFYFTNIKDIAKQYSDSKSGKLYSAYLQINKSLNSTKKTITKQQLMVLIKTLDPNGESILSNWGDVNSDGYNRVLREAVNAYYDGNNNDVELISVIINDNGRDYDNVYKILKNVLKYDGIITKPNWGHDYGEHIVYVVFSSNQIKLADTVVKDDQGNIIPLSKRFNIGSEDIRESILSFKDYLTESANLDKLKKYLKVQNSKDAQYLQITKDYSNIEYHGMKLYDFWKSQINTLTSPSKKDFGKWVNSQIKLGNFSGNTFQNISNTKELFDEWFIHFTDYVDEIIKDGFLYGVPSDKLSQLYDTRQLDKDEKKIKNKNGFCFAYRLKTYKPTEYETKKMNYILFKGDGIEFNHKLDGEKQCVVDVKTVEDIIPFYYSKGSYYNTDIDGNKIIFDKDLSIKEKCDSIINGEV
jgi:hypothetical protein